MVESGDWELVGDLSVPDGDGPFPAVLMLNQAAGSRATYGALAEALLEQGVASLRLDLRGHGESTNLGRFNPGEIRRDPLIWDAEPDVAAALERLRSETRLDAERLAVVGASYSAEEAAESGRQTTFAHAYVLLSPGSLDDASIAAMDGSGADWLVISSETDSRLTDIMASVSSGSALAETRILPGRGHGTGLFDHQPALVADLVAWLAARLDAPGVL
ncbi:MAG: hypothetical protein AAF389_02860 [Gemmatimonadota bacterium]